MDVRAAYADRRRISTRLGELSYLDVGDGDPALFVHGVFLSSFLWRHVIAALAKERRCIAVDLPGHGRSPFASDQDLSLPALADLLAALCAELALPMVDLVGNDTGGAICQVLAARHPRLVRTLTLTNCDTDEALPPPAAQPLFEAARAGKVAPQAHRMATDHAAGRSALASAFERAEYLTDEDLDFYLEPFAAVEGGRGLERLMTSLDEADLRACRPALADFNAPTLIVWGTGDAFFDRRLAYRLRDRIGGATEVVELAGAKLFFPDERADELVPLLRRHWEVAKN